MTAAVSVKSIKKAQAKLQLAYNDAQKKFYAAQEVAREASDKLCKFNDKYGRVIAMMDADKED